MSSIRKMLTIASLAFAVASMPPALFAKTTKVEGRAVKAAGAINPPDPVAWCKRAKDAAWQNAINQGLGPVETWDHLSVDSDCKLTTSGAARMGYYYIFTARGNFIQP